MNFIYFCYSINNRRKCFKLKNDVKYFINRIENNDRAKSGIAFFFVLFFQGLIFIPIMFAIYFALNNVLLFIFVSLFFLSEIIYSVVICRFYVKNRFVNNRAITCYDNGEILIECKEGHKKIRIEDVKKISYSRFWVPVSYIMYDQEGSPHYSRYFTPFFKICQVNFL